MTIIDTGTTSATDLDKIRVAVRVRPLNKRETNLATKCIVTIADKQISLAHPNQEKEPKPFTFDHCFNSIHVDDPCFCDQPEVFEAVGNDVVENAFAGYNACVFAYGQTGSGKSYTMMGSPESPGLIPRLCTAIFERIQADTNDTTSFKVEVSYMEIYNEKVRDLLDPKINTKGPLKVREHKILGPMVEGLAVLAVSGYVQIARLLDDGNKCRTVAATNMNAESSRSHAVFTIRLTQTMTDLSDAKFIGEKVSRISLVDLAGSERAQKTGAIGRRLEEGANINKSLTTLGMVISALAERTSSATKREKFIPYRDSVLTWLLKDNLGGNSKTVMIATVSPSSDNYEETLSTLRYADRAKKIVNYAKVNEDPNAKIIRELREEVETLRLQITQNLDIQNEAEELRERLAESERLVALMNKSWEERLRDTDVLNTEHRRDLTKIGVSVAQGGIMMEKDRFYLVNLNADPSLNELLVYYINQQAVIGSAESLDGEAPPVDFLLQGLGVHARHALLEIVQEPLNTADGNELESRPRLYISALSRGSRICVNGSTVEYGQRILLCNGYRLLIGNNHFFRVNCPRDESLPSSSSSSGAFAQDCAATTAVAGYDRAWLEANGADYCFPVHQYIEEIAIKHEEEKQAALEKQYEEFQSYIHGLTQTMQAVTPSTPLTPSANFLLTAAGTPSSCGLTPSASLTGYPRQHVVKSNFFNWVEKRKELFKQSLDRLKTEIIRAHALAREANLITEELWTREASRRGLVRYEVTLQIPAANLRPSKIKAGNSVCEPVVVVKWCGMSGWQLWSVERLESKLVDLRELYNEQQHRQQQQQWREDDKSADVSATNIGDDSGRGSSGSTADSPTNELSTLTTFESQEKHSLIGVANVFLEVLFHQLKLDYHVPIISQQGEVCGKLHVEVYRLPDNLTSSDADVSYEEEDYFTGQMDGEGFLGRVINCRVRIKSAFNLPVSLSHFVFCQYSFFNMSEMLVVAPHLASPSTQRPVNASNTFRFDHQKDFAVVVTEEFLEYVQEDALSIEVWGHRSSGIVLDNDEHASAGASKTSHPPDIVESSFSANITSGLTKLLSFGVPKTINENNKENVKNISHNCTCENKTDDASDVQRRATHDLRDIVARKQKSLQERWAEVTKRVELWVEILEMNEDGRYMPVDVIPVAAPRHAFTAANAAAIEDTTDILDADALPNEPAGVRTGGIYQLRQGQQRRIRLRLRTVTDDSTWNCLPLGFADIVGVSVGAVVVARNGELVLGVMGNSASDGDGDDSNAHGNYGVSDSAEIVVNGSAARRPLDSYQEEDLERIREQWLRALADRHDYLEAQIQQLTSRSPSNKSEADWEREQSLISQWVELTEERNAVSLPPANSHIPGAPADWQPPQGIEYYVPVTFLNLDAEELAANEAALEEDDDALVGYGRMAGLNTILPFECYERMIPLPILHKDLTEMHATCSWDSSIHACAALNRAPTALSELVYANVTCRLAYPFSVDVVLRKRICMNIYRRPGLAERLMRRIVGVDTIPGTGVFYDIVAHIPKSSLDMEDRSALAMMAVRHTVSYGEEEFQQQQKLLDSGDVSSSMLSSGAKTVSRLALSSSSGSASSGSSLDDDEEEDASCVEYRDGVRIVRAPRSQRRQRRRRTSAATRFSSYIESYAKAIQAVEWMLKLDRLRQENAMRNMISRQENRSKGQKSRAIYRTSSIRMKRAVSLPSTINKMALPPPAPPAGASSRLSSGMSRGATALPPAYVGAPAELLPSATNGVTSSSLEMSTSAASSGYASMANSMLSPGADGGESARLYGINEELLDSPARSPLLPSSSHANTGLYRIASKLRASFTVQTLSDFSTPTPASSDECRKRTDSKSVASKCIQGIVNEEDETQSTAGSNFADTEDYCRTNQLFSDDEMTGPLAVSELPLTAATSAAMIISDKKSQDKLPSCKTTLLTAQCENPLMSASGRRLTNRCAVTIDQNVKQQQPKKLSQHQSQAQQQNGSQRLCQQRLCQQRRVQSEAPASGKFLVKRQPQYFANTRQAVAAARQSSNNKPSNNITQTTTKLL